MVADIYSSSLTKTQKLVIFVIFVVALMGGLMGAIIYGISLVRNYFYIESLKPYRLFSIQLLATWEHQNLFMKSDCNQCQLVRFRSNTSV